MSKRLLGSLLLAKAWWHINTIPCKSCGARLWFKGEATYIEGIECEYECLCSECEEQVNYFAYGNFELAFHRTEAVANFFYRIKWRYMQWKMWRSMRNGKLPPLRRVK